MFLVFVRLSTPREAPDKFIGARTFGQLIYDNFLIDVPRHGWEKISSKDQ